MINYLKKNNDGSWDIVSFPNEVKQGDEFQIGFNSVTKEPIMKTINNIVEQRKERGRYEDESKRRFWARVS